MNRSFKDIVMILLTQCMINLGEIEDPIQGKLKNDLVGAQLFIELLEILDSKTKGNLSDGEEKLLVGAISNVKKIYDRKLNPGQGDG